MPNASCQSRPELFHRRVLLVEDHDRVPEEIAEQHRPDRQEADHHRRDGQQHQRQGDDPGRLVRYVHVPVVMGAGLDDGGVRGCTLAFRVVLVVMVVVRPGVVVRFRRERLVAETLRSVEDQEIQAERIERGHEDADQHGGVGEAGAVQVARVHRLDDRILGVEPGEERRADQRQGADQERDPRDGHVLAQAAHVADVLIVVHADDHRAGGEEQQRLEERVRHQVEDRHRIRRGAERHRHVAELRQRRVGDDALDVVLDDAEKAHEQRRDRADHEHHGQRRVGELEQRRHARHHEDAGGHHGRRVDQRGDRRRAFHRVRAARRAAGIARSCPSRR